MTCLHPAGPNRTGKMLGEKLYNGCPALRATDFSREANGLHTIAKASRGLTFKESMEAPATLLQAFRALDSELPRIAAAQQEKANGD